MGCVNTLQKTRCRPPDVERTQRYYKNMESGIEANQDNINEGLAQYNQDSQIVKRNPIKKTKSGVTYPQQNGSPLTIPVKSYSSSGNYEEHMKMINDGSYSNQKSWGGKSTHQSSANAQNYDDANHYANKENQQKKIRQHEEFNDYGNGYSPGIKRDSMRDKRQPARKKKQSSKDIIKFYSNETPLPTVDELSQQQIESIIVRSSMGIKNKASMPLPKNQQMFVSFNSLKYPQGGSQGNISIY